MAEGTEAYEGLAVPLFGESKIVGNTAANDVFTIEGASSQTGDFLVCQTSTPTEVFYIESDGVTNWSITSPGTDNCVSLTITDASTISGGYLQGYYCSLTTSGSYATGSAQINAIAVDLLLGGVIACEAEAAYFWIGASSTPTVSSANVSGLVVYVDDLGACAYCSDVFLHWKSSSAHTESAYIIMKGESASAPNAAIQFSGKYPAFFLRAQQSETGCVISATVNGTQNKALKCNIYGSSYCIPLYVTS